MPDWQAPSKGNPVAPGIQGCPTRASLFGIRSPSEVRLDLPLHLLDEPVDVGVAEAGRDHPGPGVPPRFGNPVVRLDGDDHRPRWVDAAPLQLGGDLAGRALDDLALDPQPVSHLTPKRSSALGSTVSCRFRAGKHEGTDSASNRCDRSMRRGAAALATRTAESIAALDGQPGANPSAHLAHLPGIEAEPHALAALPGRRIGAVQGVHLQLRPVRQDQVAQHRAVDAQVGDLCFHL